MYTNQELNEAINNETLAVKLSTGALENLHMDHLRELIRERERRVMEQSKPVGISIPPVTPEQVWLCAIEYNKVETNKLHAALEAYRNDIMKEQP